MVGTRENTRDTKRLSKGGDGRKKDIKQKNSSWDSECLVCVVAKVEEKAENYNSVLSTSGR